MRNRAGDLWVPAVRRPAEQRGETDGPSGDSLAQDRACSVPACARVCVGSTGRPGHAAFGDHLSSALSCSVSSTVVALPDTEGFCRLCSDILFFYVSCAHTHTHTKNIPTTFARQFSRALQFRASPGRYSLLPCITFAAVIRVLIVLKSRHECRGYLQLARFYLHSYSRTCSLQKASCGLSG